MIGNVLPRMGSATGLERIGGVGLCRPTLTDAPEVNKQAIEPVMTWNCESRIASNKFRGLDRPEAPRLDARRIALDVI